MLWFCKTQPKKKKTKQTNNILAVDKHRQTHMKKSHNKKNNRSWCKENVLQKWV